jgi:DNA primase
MDTNFTRAEVSSYYRSRVPILRQSQAGEWRSPCLIHKGEGDNFSVNPETGNWFCHSQCGRGGSLIDLEMELSSLDFKAAKERSFG